MELPEYRDDADWILTLRPLKSSVPAARRMARLLKSCLRAFGFRAVDYYQRHQRTGHEPSTGTARAGS